MQVAKHLKTNNSFMPKTKLGRKELFSDFWIQLVNEDQFYFMIVLMLSRPQSVYVKAFEKTKDVFLSI